MTSTSQPPRRPWHREAQPDEASIPVLFSTSGNAHMTQAVFPAPFSVSQAGDDTVRYSTEQAVKHSTD